MAQLHKHDPNDASKSHGLTVQQLLRGAEASKYKGSSSEKSKRWESVITKVKVKAKKLRHSLSKKKHDDSTASSTVGDDDDDDTEYLRAPMYESEQAPGQYKEKSKEHPRTSSISEKHVLPNSGKSKYEGDKEASPSPSKSKKKTVAHNTAPGSIKTTPDFSARHSFNSGFPGLTVETHEQGSSSSSTPSTSRRKVSSPKTPKPSKTYHDASNMPQLSSSAPGTPQGSTYKAQIWDKGISVKEYLMNKFEPGEEDKALSQVISEALSPKKAPGDKGVVEKFKDAVSSLLQVDEPSQSSATQTSPEIPLSANTNDVGQEANGSTLQAN